MHKKMSKPKTTKTTIDIDEELYKKFSIIVIKKHGGRKKNDVITELIKEYVEKNGKDCDL
jgi:metal-responsive CopG/Arc/MetJ family transcriptional regulator